MYSRYYIFKFKAIALRKAGKTYGQIKRILKKSIAKSTLSHWLRDVVLTKIQQERLKQRASITIKKAQIKAWAVNKAKRDAYIQEVRRRVVHLPRELHRKDIAKVALVVLYLGEGFKNTNGAVGFGNSDPKIIQLFLRLLRKCYDVDETKFRITLQCRADQDVDRLQKFWSRVTHISPRQFYKAQIDPRTVGIPTRRPNYKGVCRVVYLSADIFNELQQAGSILCTGP